MQSKEKIPDEYIAELPAHRRETIIKLRSEVLKNLPEGFLEVTCYGMITYVVSLSIYSSGYHCTPSNPLPFVGFASQKNFITFYHMGIYSDPALLNWFVKEYPKHTHSRLDMGKSCIRSKSPKKYLLNCLVSS